MTITRTRNPSEGVNRALTDEIVWDPPNALQPAPRNLCPDGISNCRDWRSGEYSRVCLANRVPKWLVSSRCLLHTPSGTYFVPSWALDRCILVKSCKWLRKKNPEFPLEIRHFCVRWVHKSPIHDEVHIRFILGAIFCQIRLLDHKSLRFFCDYKWSQLQIGADKNPDDVEKILCVLHRRIVSRS